MNLTINRITCDGAGLCAELLPESITLDEWGYPIIQNRSVPKQSEPHAHRAASLCPTLALRLSKPKD